MKRDSKNRGTPWYERAFSADYLARYKHRSDRLARTEVPFVLAALQLRPGAVVLDLCCGAGRHSRSLASALRRGRVIGLDLSPELLRAAQARNKIRRRLCFVRGDMRCLPLRSRSVDGVINLFTSFGYFETDRENMAVLKEIARVLKPRGRLVFDFFNAARVLATLVPRSEGMRDGHRIVEHRRYDRKSRRIVKTIQCNSGERYRESVRAYSAAELKRLLQRSGLKPLKLYGDLNGSKFNAQNSPRCVWVCETAPVPK